MLHAIAIAALVIVALAIAGWTYHSLGAAADLRRHPPPGRMVDIGGYRLHMLAAGEGSPTVVFDSGLPGSVLSWIYVQPELSRLTRTVSYDRAGLGWSDSGPKPRTAGRIVDELHCLLNRASIAPPYVLVGHSFGGLTMRLYAARYPEEVAALVLVDPVGPGEWLPLSEREARRLNKGARMCRRAGVLARLGVNRFVALLVRMGAHRAAQAAFLAISDHILPDVRTTIGPVTKLPVNAREAARMFWVLPKFYEAMGGQVEGLPESAVQVAGAGDSLGARPVVVISAANTQPARLAEQIAATRLSLRGRHVIASGCGHWIQLERPELVVGVVAEVLRELRGVAAPASVPSARDSVRR